MKLTDVDSAARLSPRRRDPSEDGRTIVFQVAPGANKVRSARRPRQLLAPKSRASAQHRARQDQAAGRYAGADRLERRLRESAKARRC